MLRKMLQAGVFAALGMIAMTSAYGVATSAEDKIPDNHTIMSKIFGKGGLNKTVSTDVKEEKWEDASKHAKEMAEYGAALPKNKAEKGDAKSWETLSKKFADNTKAIVEAVDKKDAPAAKKALGAFDCKTCHTAHKQ